MLFNSYQFVFFFLPLVILSIFFSQVYFKLKYLKILILILFSLFFYAYDNYNIPLNWDVMVYYNYIGFN